MHSPIIEVKKLSKYYLIHKKNPGMTGIINSFFNRKYEEIKAVDSISFSVEEGELIGFIGPNGAGKTTTLKILSGLLYPTKGEVSVLGFRPWDRKKSFQKKFGIVMGQKNQLWWDLPAIDTFVLNKEIYEVSDSEYRKTLSELISLLEVSDQLKIPVKNLSLGQRMKMELIASLIHSPKILFLDEPTIGLDVIMQKKMREFIKEYNFKKKSTIILTSHYMSDVKELAKRVIVIDGGNILFDGKLSDLVKKFTRTKTISIGISKKVNAKQLEGLGKIQEFTPEKVVLSVKIMDVTKATARILRELPVNDLKIEEPSVEEIVREFFSLNSK